MIGSKRKVELIAERVETLELMQLIALSRKGTPAEKLEALKTLGAMSVELKEKIEKC